MGRTSEHSVCFTIDGDWLADFARTRFEEGAWERALALLTESLDGLTTDQAVSIIKGEATFTGDSNTGLELIKLGEDSPIRQRMVARTEWMYGNVFRHGDHYWKPYARVVGPWNQEDYNWALHNEHKLSCRIFGHSPANDGTRSGKKYHIGRSLFYANNASDDMLVFVTAGAHAHEILCERTEMPPFWLKMSVNEPADFLERLILDGRLGRVEERGAYEETHAVIHDYHIPEEEMCDAPDITDVPEPQPEPNASSLVSEFLDALNGAESPSAVRQIERDFERRIDAIRNIPHPVWGDIEGARKRAHQAEVNMYRKRICEQAEQHGGYMRLELTKPDGTPYSPNFIDVPKNPFIKWCLRHFNYENYGKTEPVWENVAPHGFKMMNDDPNHTDFVIGAGVDPREAYDHADRDEADCSLGAALMDAAYTIRGDIVKEWTQVEFSFLAKSSDKYITGKVVRAQRGKPVPAGCIALCEDASVDYHMVLETINDGRERGAIICQTGGKLAHMATVGREYDVMVLLVPDALTKYRPDDLLFIDLKTMTISTHII